MTDDTPNPYNCQPQRVADYMGLYQPRCREGRGCEACWAKYNSDEAKAAREAAGQ